MAVSGSCGNTADGRQEPEGSLAVESGARVIHSARSPNPGSLQPPSRAKAGSGYEA
jgi:hypothetical protein